MWHMDLGSQCQKRGVSHCGLVIYMKKGILRQKKNYENSKYYTMQKYNLHKNPLKETKIL
jgi:hypothetical protein